jgi:UTP--glucose-1-phosphate uridylyltransferase
MSYVKLKSNQIQFLSKPGIYSLIFVTGKKKCAIEDHFDANNELETTLRAKGKDAQANMVRNIIPKGVECIFLRQAK